MRASLDRRKCLDENVGPLTSPTKMDLLEERTRRAGQVDILSSVGVDGACTKRARLEVLQCFASCPGLVRLC